MKLWKRCISIALAATMVVILTIPADAAGKKQIALNKTAVTIYVGGNVKLKIKGTKKPVKWSTSNKKVAAVRNGKVTGKKAGTAKIIAKVGKKSYRCRVKVKNPALNKTSLSLYCGESTTIRLKGGKIKSVKSSKPSVAAIKKSGRITAKKPGTATMTVTSTKRKKYTCKVMVTEKTHTHTYEEISRTESTCRTAGSITERCTACGDVRTTVLALSGHSWPTGWTYNEQTEMDEKRCTVCGELLENRERQSGDEDPAEKETVTRGLEYGLYTSVKTGNTVTFKEFASCLEQLIRSAAASDGKTDGETDTIVRAWQNEWASALASDEIMSRYDGMVLLLSAAEALGTDYLRLTYDLYAENWNTLYGTVQDSGEWNWHDELLDIWDKKITLYDMDGNVSSTDGYFISAYFFAQYRQSYVDDLYLFAPDTARKSMRCGDNLTWGEALTAVVRLFESVLRPDVTVEGASVLTGEEDAAILDAAEKRRREIQNSSTEIALSDTYTEGETYTGTAYYVSPYGDDTNDGLTPETAWKSLDKVGTASDPETGVLKYGDAVFFERGGVFRTDGSSTSGLKISTPGVTYSAYGEGAKPVITASPESGADAGKWELYYSDDNGVKIWKYYKDMYDTAAIICNDGKVYTDRVYEYWKEGQGYRSVTGDYTGKYCNAQQGITYADALFPVEESLTEDLTIISRPDLSDVTPDSGAGGILTNIDSKPGPLYFRCDAGNPGEIFDSVEFSTFNILGLAWVSESDVVFDNLNFQCGGHNLIKNGTGSDTEPWNLENIVIQNCEFAFCGGSVTAYGVGAYQEDDGQEYINVQGDTIYNIMTNAVIKNNYFHDLCASSINNEAADDDSVTKAKGGFTIRGNLFENTGGIWLNSGIPSLNSLDYEIVDDNMVLNTAVPNRNVLNGYFDGTECALCLQTSQCENAVVTNNVFYYTEGVRENTGLLRLSHHMYDYFGVKPIYYENNTYVQTADRDFASFETQGEAWSITAPDLLKRAAVYLGDTTSKFYIGSGRSR